jgi:uncharacterized Zn finger protein
MLASFTIVCNECGSKNVFITATIDLEVLIKCNDCGTLEEVENDK